MGDGDWLAAANRLAAANGGSGDPVGSKRYEHGGHGEVEATVALRYLRKNQASMGKPNSGSVRVAVTLYTDGRFAVCRVGRGEKSRLGAAVASVNRRRNRRIRAAERRAAASTDTP